MEIDKNMSKATLDVFSNLKNMVVVSVFIYLLQYILWLENAEEYMHIVLLFLNCVFVLSYTSAFYNGGLKFNSIYLLSAVLQLPMLTYFYLNTDITLIYGIIFLFGFWINIYQLIYNIYLLLESDINYSMLIHEENIDAD